MTAGGGGGQREAAAGRTLDRPTARPPYCPRRLVGSDSLPHANITDLEVGAVDVLPDPIPNQPAATFVIESAGTDVVPAVLVQARVVCREPRQYSSLLAGLGFNHTQSD